MIIIPMAGLSKRFAERGFQLPKYMLEAKDKTLFEHSLLSFERYFQSVDFLFICLDVNNTVQFVRDKCRKLNISSYKIITLKGPTEGQAETVYEGLIRSASFGDGAATIFNIDTFRRNFCFPDASWCGVSAGFLETFIGQGSNWSNIVPLCEKAATVKFTAEKKQVSNLCCTGLYHWSNVEDFLSIYESYRKIPIEELDGQERYIAPMYNELISQGAMVKYTVIPSSEVTFCGVPEEYYEFINS